VELFERKFFNDSHFFRVVPKFLVQFGISYSKDHELQKLARTPIQDDPNKGMKFHSGTISYAGAYSSRILFFGRKEYFPVGSAAHYLFHIEFHFLPQATVKTVEHRSFSSLMDQRLP
jgi:hypothetical protein